MAMRFLLLVSMALHIRAHRTIAFRCDSPLSLFFSATMPKRANPSVQEQHSKKVKTQRSLSGFFSASKRHSSGDDTKSAATSLKISNKDNTTEEISHQIFCDLDGVLVDFNAGVKELFNGRAPEELPNQGMMWGGISKADRFYARLPWTPDGKALWEELKNLPTTPHILTGVPRSNKSRVEKFAWCKKELGITVNHVDMAGKKSAHELVTGRRKNKSGVVNVITCWSKNKHCESKQNHILIDDRFSLGEAWEKRGGIFIHHTSTERTISILREKGILESRKNPENEE